MSEAALKLLEQVMTLPPDDQAEFTRRLLDADLPEDDETEEEATARWEAELDQRLAAIADGSMATVSLADGIAQARAELARRKGNG